MAFQALPALAIAASIARGLGVPVGKLTLKMIQNAKIPSRFKKFATRERTTGEKTQGPKNLVRGSVGVAEKEVGAFGKGVLTGGTVVGGLGIGAASLIYKASKGTDSKTKSSVSPTKRDDKAMKKTLDKKAEIKKRTSVINEKAGTLKKQKQIKRGIDKSLEEVKREAGFPQKRPKMNKGGMPKKNHAKPGSYGNAYMKGGMAKKKK